MTPEEEPRGSFTAARAAQKAGIPVSTISFGTAYGSIEINPGERTPVAVDDDSMQRIADLSGGQFFTAATEEELRRVYGDLSEQIGYETRRVDVSWPWLAGGVMLLVVGVASGMVLGRRLP
jgi:Ca-activated chloride channel family protein